MEMEEIENQDISSVEKMARQIYWERFGRRDDRRQAAEDSRESRTIPPSDVPKRLACVSEEEMIRKQRIVTPRERTPPYIQERDIPSDDEEEEERSWKRTRTDDSRSRETGSTDNRKRHVRSAI